MRAAEDFRCRGEGRAIGEGVEDRPDLPGRLFGDALNASFDRERPEAGVIDPAILGGIAENHAGAAALADEEREGVGGSLRGVRAGGLDRG